MEQLSFFLFWPVIVPDGPYVGTVRMSVLSVCNTVFIGVTHFFLIFCMKTVQKILKNDESFLEKNSCYAQNGVIFGLKVNTVEFLCKSVHQIVQKLYLMANIKKLVQSYYCGFLRNVLITSSFHGPKINTFQFSLNLYIGFFWNYTLWQLIKTFKWTVLEFL